jgi:hypothetical protein
MLHPCTIMKARYQGTYEGAPWLALNCYPEDYPSEAHGDDITCGAFWDTVRRGVRCYDKELFGKPTVIIVGMGLTPDEAVADLRRKLDVQQEAG